MSISPPEALEAWMCVNPSMLSWDMIASQPLSLLHYTVQQQELQRLAGQVFAVINGQALREEDDSLHELDNYIVRVQEISIEANGYARPMLHVQLSLERGSYVKSSYLGEVMSISVHDSVSRLQATMKVPIHFENGQVLLDLGQGQNHTLLLNSTADLELLGPQMLKAGLGALTSAQRVIVLADILSSPDNTFRQVSQVHTAVQGGEELPPALLFFVNFSHGAIGRVPTDGLGFPSLLPNVVDDWYASSAILSWRLLHRTAYGHSILGVLQGAEYRYVQSEREPKALEVMEALKGELTIPGAMCLGWGGELLPQTIVVPGVGGKSALKIAFADEAIRQTWQPRCTVQYSYRRVGVEQELKTGTITIEPRLDYVFELTASPDNTLIGHFYDMPEHAAATISDPSTDEQIIEALAHYAVRRGFLNALYSQLTAHLDRPFLNCLRQPDGLSIQPQVSYRPNNLLLIGGFKSTDRSFRIFEQNTILPGAAKTVFSHVPQVNLVQWSIDPLLGTAGDIGKINEITGEYEAPTAAALGEKNQLIRVSAEDTYGGERSEALVELIGRTLDFNPKFATCLSNRSIELRADLLEDPTWANETLEWDVLDPRPGSGKIARSSVHSGIAHYTAAAPRDDVTYVIDQIQVKGLTSGRTAIGYVLVTHKDPTLHVSVDDTWTGPGLKIEARLLGSTTPLPELDWTMGVEKNGQIDSSGVCTPHEDAKFVVIMAKKQGSTKTYEGQLTIPLPLNSFAELRKKQIVSHRQVKAKGDESA